jgi:hypothetical protein
MPKSRYRKCQHCKDNYLPDARNAARQRFCTKPECRKVRAAECQRKWLNTPTGKNYFHHGESTQRVRRWRSAHPGYRQAQRRRREQVQQDSLIPLVVEPDNEAKSEPVAGRGVQQDFMAEQPALLVGLISHLMGDVQQDAIEPVMQGLISRGQAVKSKCA